MLRIVPHINAVEEVNMVRVLEESMCAIVGRDEGYGCDKV